ncbi:hypothetical protein [Neobacillus sp.]|uniref:hypothetical protein n=1 Tax=Neobacillus sp. TaxID=2675273 RepID=UPI00289982E0|nr:hypothetical protein [Neobacillus sp.]
MMGNYHVPCGAGEKLEITSNAYLLQTSVEQSGCCGSPFSSSTKMADLLKKDIFLF